MNEVSRKMRHSDFITQIDMKAGLHSIGMALGHEKFAAFMTRFGPYEYMVILFGLMNAPAAFQGEINRILQPLLGMELPNNTKEEIDKDGGMVVVAYIDDILTATKVSIDKHYQQVGTVFQLLLENNMCVDINKCIFDAKEVPFLGFIVSGVGLSMDPEKSKAIVDWPGPTNEKKVQQL